MASNESLKDDLTAIASIKAAQDALAAELKVVQERLVKGLQAKRRATVSVVVGDQTIRGTLVEGQRVVIDADKLKGALTPKQWRKVTSTVLDNEKLEAAVVSKEVDEQDVANASEVRDNKPYIRVSGKIPQSSLPKVEFEPDVHVDLRRKPGVSKR